ncbi:MAG TPA: HypC/HybG/HupF family hydrogenase formation chaperone [Kiritimatiellia bacterium]|nr:HypC/HybG/HupF family hydrogenase formation chaperone [Kiritimatiellia bacterium]
MCLAIPGQIVGVDETDSVFRMGKVRFGGIQREVNLAYVPEARVNDYVLVHVGFALSVIDEQEAAKVFDLLREMDELEELSQEPEA